MLQPFVSFRIKFCTRKVKKERGNLTNYADVVAMSGMKTLDQIF